MRPAKVITAVPVLVIVENGNITFLFQFFLNLKTPGSRDVLQVYAAEAAGDHVNGVDDLVLHLCS